MKTKMKTKTAVIKRSIYINGQKTSASLEKEFWEGLHAIAKQKGTSNDRQPIVRNSTFRFQSLSLAGCRADSR
jgi:predicted DNA-binding ribbon-helix-helix protein